MRLRGTRLDGAVHESLYDYIIDYKKPKKRNKKELTIKQEAETFDEKGISMSERASLWWQAVFF